MAKQFNKLAAIWSQQVSYNEKVRQVKPMGHLEWMKDYLLGVVSEMNEVLNELSWKAHKRGKPIDRINLARELADLTKYVFSLWECAGFSMEDMLHFVYQKGEELEQMWKQDFDLHLRPNSQVVISDIDGTLADYRKGFLTWLRLNHGSELPEDSGRNLAMEIDLGLPYPLYVQYKEEFESSGGYANLPIYPDVEIALTFLLPYKVHFLAYTARPAHSYSRIWYDTWQWLEGNGISLYFSELRIGKEHRIARACQLQEEGHSVVLLEDDPELALRAAAAGIPVYLRHQPYNDGVYHKLITRFEGAIPFGEILATLDRREAR